MGESGGGGRAGGAGRGQRGRTEELPIGRTEADMAIIRQAREDRLAGSADPGMDREQRWRFYDRVIDGDSMSVMDQIRLEEQLDLLAMSDMAGVRRVTLWPGVGYEMEPNGFGGADGSFWGLYYPYNKTVHIHPNALAYGPGTAIHEFGHHRWPANIDSLVPYHADEAGMVRALRTRSNATLASMGLRRYSTGSMSEFMADAFKVWHLGSDDQWNKLARYVDGKAASVVPANQRSWFKSQAGSFADIFGARRPGSRSAKTGFRMWPAGTQRHRAHTVVTM